MRWLERREPTDYTDRIPSVGDAVTIYYVPDHSRILVRSPRANMTTGFPTVFGAVMILGAFVG